MAKSQAGDPLAPIDTTVSVLSWLVGGLLVLSVVLGVAAALGGPFSILGFGNTEVCTSAKPGVVPFGDVPQDAAVGLSDDARWFPDKPLICKSDPSIGLRLAASLSALLVGIGLITIGRVLHQGARMQDEVKPTV
jgi:hypothetical protein